MSKKIDRPKVKTKFLQLVSDGMSAREACKRPEIVSFRAISNWLMEDEEFREQYRVAMELRAQYLDDKIDYALQDMRDGVIDAQQARVEIDTYKWRAAKLYPKMYGENQKVQVEHSAGSFVDALKLAAAEIEQRKLEAKTIEGELVDEE